MTSYLERLKARGEGKHIPEAPSKGSKGNGGALHFGLLNLLRVTAIGVFAGARRMPTPWPSRSAPRYVSTRGD